MVGDLAAAQPPMAQILGLRYCSRRFEGGSMFLIFQTGS